MAKTSAIAKNNRREKLIKKNQAKRDILLKIAKDQSLSFEERFIAQTKLAKLPRNSASVRYRNRCAVTGRPRGFFRQFSLSRIALRDLASWGRIPGLVKSSW